LGVPLPAVTALIAVNQATAVLGALFGPLIDRIGYRPVMLFGMGLLAVGMFAAGFLPVYAVVLVSLLLAGMGKSIFDPAIQAYLSRRVPYHRRGAVIGILETSWSGATLAGIPLIGVLIDRIGWRAPFFALGCVSLLGLAILALLLSPDPPRGTRDPSDLPVRSGKALWPVWKQVLRTPSAAGALGFSFFVSAANDNLFVVYGVWLEGTFGLSVLALGLGTATIGLAELTGEGLTATVADRFGLLRSVTVGLVLVIVLFVLLPLAASTYLSAMAGLFLLFLVFEFTFVTSLSLATELVPAARATMMSLYFAAAGLGRVCGALLGGILWSVGGIEAIGGCSAVLGGVAMVFLRYGSGRRGK
jgi:predicted MFS family arabinose efflux permease